jgi:hypothetical protein
MKFRFCAHDLRKAPLLVAKTATQMMLDVALQSQALAVSGGLPSASWQLAWLGIANFTPADLVT